MINFIDRIFDSFESGKISRREAVARLAALALGVMGAKRITTASEASSTFLATSLNHVGLRVSDVAVSRDFYQEHLGLTIIRDNTPGNCFMACGDNFIGLFRSNNPGFDHYCYTVEGYGPDDAEKKLKNVGIATQREENRIYFDDPDGLTTQVSGKWDAWPGPSPGR